MRNVPLCLFDETASGIVADMSLAPSKLTSQYMPASYGLWGCHLANALAYDGCDAMTFRYVISDGANVLDLSNLTAIDFCTGKFELNGSPKFVRTPCLIANGFDLAIAMEERAMPEEIEKMAQSHRREIIWVRRDEWEGIRDGARMSKSLPGQERVEADLRNVESAMYVIALTSPRVIKNQK